MSGAPPPVLVWFTCDLRLTDHAALTRAVGTGSAVVPCYVLDDSVGSASRWWLHGSLAALEREVARRGGRLVLRRGPARDALVALAREVGAQAVFASARHEPAAAAEERAVAAALARHGVELTTCAGRLLLDPATFRNRAGEPFRVFTPFWRSAVAVIGSPEPLPVPAALAFHAPAPRGDALEDWKLRPTAPDWARGIRARWQPGEAEALARLEEFLERDLGDYAELRDRPGRAGTSRLSPALHFGEVSPRQVWAAALAHASVHGPTARGAQAYLRELGWREFSYHLLAQRPDLPERSFRSDFAHFPWRDDEPSLVAWQRGATGYPIVDAGMRELWRTGWMHNRARMIVASFLTKHLLIPWQRGAAWFLDTLVDADLASNSAGWQWVAGCGADAAPYFRIFNPVLQGKKFDAGGDYVRRFVPELARLDAASIHSPWAASAAALAAAGIELGRDYPRPLVDHGFARERALAAYAAMKRAVRR